jgi:hypothetical protein
LTRISSSVCQSGKHDWENSHPLDLSDEGLFADLEDRAEGSAEKLALDVDEKAVKHHKKKRHDK